VTFLVGALRFGRTGAVGLVLLLAPLGIAFAAALLQLAPFPTSTQYQLLDGYYPFFGRVLLFSVPPVLIVVAAGIGGLIELRVRPLAWLGGAAVAVLLATPLYVLVRNTISPPVIQDMRTLAEQMRPHAEASDLLLTLGYAEPTVEYYALRYGLPRPFAVLRVRTRRQIETTQRVLGSIPPGRRFWFATVHHPHWPTRDEREALLPMFDRIADELLRFESYRGDAHLYRRR
jgi:hypothetical protein